MPIKKIFQVFYGVFFVFLIGFSLISIRLSLNQKGLYLGLIIGLLILLSSIVALSLITINRRVNKPIRMLQDATHRVATDVSRLTQAATGLANGDLSQTAQIQTQPLEIKTKDELGNLAQDFNQMIAQLQETGDTYAKTVETIKSPDDGC